MTDPTLRNLDGYGAPIIEWERVRQRLDEGATQAPESGGPNRHTTWLATTNPDGRPHVVPLGMMWDDGKAYFTSGLGARKAKNLALSPHCTLSVATQPFDIVVEGQATIVTDEATLQRGAELYEGWGPTVRDGAFYHEFSAPSAGPPPWYLYEVTPETVFAFGTAEPYGATRFDF
jgi:nitroimidazol reductase NimA-like FMN-containing flavoprotein (pyridoxamine 5'-phosphate oxidase superfamily)